MNGARIRSMKQHLSHCPHQWSRRRLCRCERPGYSCGTCRGTASAPRTAPRPTARSGRGARRSSRAGPPGRPARSSRKPPRTAADLDHWWLTGRPSCSSVGTEADHSLDITTASRVVEHRGEDGDRGDDAGHRHVPVEEPELRRPQQLRVDLPPGPDDRQPAHRGRPLDRGEPVPRPADHEQRDVGRALPHALDGHDRVDAAAERHERPRGPAAALAAAAAGAVARPGDRRGPRCADR